MDAAFFFGGFANSFNVFFCASSFAKYEPRRRNGGRAEGDLALAKNRWADMTLFADAFHSDAELEVEADSELLLLPLLPSPAAPGDVIDELRELPPSDECDARRWTALPSPAAFDLSEKNAMADIEFEV